MTLTQAWRRHQQSAADLRLKIATMATENKTLSALFEMASQGQTDQALKEGTLCKLARRQRHGLNLVLAGVITVISLPERLLCAMQEVQVS